MDTTKKSIRSVFTVKEKTWINEHYVRIIFSIPEELVPQLHNVKSGTNNKLFIPLPGTDTRVTRTYTNRHIDLIKKELWIDFVVHSDDGPAAYWASHAAAGDTMEIGMKESNRPLLPHAKEYLLIGDSTALPVIGAMLEQLPEGATARAMIEVNDTTCVLSFKTAAMLQIDWLYNPAPGKGSYLAQQVRSMALPAADQCFCYAATEFSTARELKQYFRQELDWPATSHQVVAYWKRGESEDQSSPERRNERL